MIIKIKIIMSYYVHVVFTIFILKSIAMITPAIICRCRCGEEQRLTIMVSDGEAVEPGVYRVCASNLGM